MLICLYLLRVTLKKVSHSKDDLVKRGFLRFSKRLKSNVGRLVVLLMNNVAI